MVKSKRKFIKDISDERVTAGNILLERIGPGEFFLQFESGESMELTEADLKGIFEKYYEEKF